MESDGAIASQPLPHPRLRLARHHTRVDVDNFSEYLSDPDEQDDQPTPKLSANTALTSETPAARLRALLSRVPNNKPILALPSSSSHVQQSRSDLVDSDVDASDVEYHHDPTTNHSVASSSSLTFARESLRDIFTRARREPGDTPQKDKTSKPRRSSFDEIDTFPKKSPRSGKRKSLSDEELEKLPNVQRQPLPYGSQTMSIDNLRERLLTESQSQLQDQHPPSVCESSSILQDINISQATAPAATSTPQALPRKIKSSPVDTTLPSHSNSHLIQSNLLEADSEMQRAMENLNSDGEHVDQVPFPTGVPEQNTEPSIRAPTSLTPSRSRIPLTRSRLNSLDKTYREATPRRVSGGHHRSVSRTSSITSTQSSMSLCDDEAERIRERERDWNKPKPPVRPSTPELKQGHLHGRFSSRMDSPMIGGSSARRTSISSINSLEDLSTSSIGSQVEYREQLAGSEHEKMHERERQWNKRRPKLSYPSPSSRSIPQERMRALSLTHPSRPDSAMSMSSTTSLRRQHSFSPSSASEHAGVRDCSGEPPGEYERERNWNSPRPRWLQNSVTSPNGRERTDISQVTSALANEIDHDPQPLAAPHHPSMQQPRSSSPIHSTYWSRIHGSPSAYPRTRAGSAPSPGPDSRPTSRNSMSRHTKIPVRVPIKSNQQQVPSSQQDTNHGQRESHSNYGSHLLVDRGEDNVSQDLTPTIRTVQPPSVDSPEDSHPNSFTQSYALDENPLADSLMHTPSNLSRHQESPRRKARANEPTSFLQTPDRSPISNNGGSFDFQSPSPPRGLPELPRPPSVSDDEDGTDLNYSSIAWDQTPTTQDNAAKAGNLTSISMKTPRPPGAWLTTPVPERGTDIQSTGAMNETEYDGGLVTPIASLSRATGAMQTPVPPGAWVPTPATARKSLRVRFEQSPHLEHSAISPLETEHTASRSSIAAAVESAEMIPETRSRTPELQSPVQKPRSPKSPRKSPKIRVMDAFGRETLDSITREDEQENIFDASAARNRSSIRIVDAMGREIAADMKEGLHRDEIQDNLSPSLLGRREALSRVRQGLSDLAYGIDEIDRATCSNVNESRVHELNELSRKARAKREELATRLFTAESDSRSQMQEALRNKSLVRSIRRASWIPSTTWILWFALIQVILILFMYQFAVKKARDIFLSTYYDPFHPDLHLYIIRPYTSSHQASWISIFDTIRHDGWRATLTILCDNVSIFIYDLRTRIWETWGEDKAQQVVSWPPT